MGKFGPPLSSSPPVQPLAGHRRFGVGADSQTASSASTQSSSPAYDKPRLRTSPNDFKVPATLRQRVLDKLEERVRFARNHWRRAFKMPTLSFSLQGTTAGTAHYGKWHIRLNAVLLVENPDQMVNDTLVHELAHLITDFLHSGASAHGKEWQSVMRQLGLVPSRTHSMDVMNSAVGTELYHYACRCGSRPFSPEIHRKCVRGRGYFRLCKQCGSRFSYQGRIRKDGYWYVDPRFKGSATTALAVGAASGRRPASSASAPARPGAQPPTPKLAAPIAPVLSRPPESFKAGVYPPSDALRKYALDLARKLNRELTKVQLQSAKELSAFVDLAKALLQTGTTATTPSAASTSASSVDEPTERQLAFARSIALRRGLVIDSTALRSRRLLSLWIDKNKT